MRRLTLVSPLDGWVSRLSEVCDEVFATGLAGDGVAIEPLGETLYAPCDGEVVLMGEARHALTLRHASGAELLMHVGIDTIALRGEGFTLLVAPGQRVRVGQALLRFDLDRIARDAKSAVTPILLASGGRVLRRLASQVVRVGEFLCEVEIPAEIQRVPVEAIETRRRYRIPFEHGLHARPAAQLVAALGAVVADVVLFAHGRSANARSAVSLMALGVQRGDEVEAVARGEDALQAIAALESLLIAIDPRTTSDSAPASPAASGLLSPPTELSGVIAVRGLALGRSVSLHEPERPIAEAGQGVVREHEALRAALSAVAVRIESSLAAAEPTQGDVLAAHLALLQDPELSRATKQGIDRGNSAAFAWRAALRQCAEALFALGDARMRERAADLRDLERQVLRVLAGNEPVPALTLPDDAILLADELLPSQLVALDTQRIAGICMARGGPTSHVALLAAARGIPTLVAAGEALLRVPDGALLLLDAERGRIAIDPPAADAAALRVQIVQRTEREAADLSAALRPAMMRDGFEIAVLANIGSVLEAGPAVVRGAEGCGLLRTEFLFLDRRAAPDEDEQAQVYAAVAHAFGARQVTIRTLDVGGDKPLAYLPMPREENPVLGLRGLRVGLRAPALLRAQLRAVLRTSRPGQVRIMLPMVNELTELRVVRAMLHECARELGVTALPALGVMIETPAAALLADQLAREADFLSIGSNDLSQYVLAMDRGHSELASRLDGLHPAVLRLIAGVASAGQRAGRSVSVCGGLGSDPEAIPILIGLGIREVSVVPASIPRIKRGIRELELAACQALAQAALDCGSAEEVRALVSTRADATRASIRQVAGAIG